MPEEPVVKKVKAFLARHDLFGKTFVVGFSGGYDSMCLLDILSQTDVKLVAAHFNHGWRIEADEEELCCKRFCEARNINFYSERASKSLKKTETDARKARYDFFLDVKDRFQADGIFTAHNANDNAETLVYRIIKGTGIVGLQGISECRDDIYRPILDCTRAEIEDYCQKNGLTPNIDSSNSDIKYKRNLIRHRILPQMSEINQDVMGAINKLSELAKQETAIVEEYLSLITKDVIDGEKIKTKAFLALSPHVRQRLLYSFLTSRLPEYDSKKISEILDFVVLNSESSAATKMSLTTNLWLSVNNCAITVYEEDTEYLPEIIVNGVGEYEFGTGKLIIEECNQIPKEFPPDATGIAYVNLSSFGFPLILRCGRSSDSFTPIGMGGSMILKKFLSGKKVLQHLRALVPVLAADNKVLWIPKMALNDCVKVSETVTHKLIWKENA